MDDDRRERDEFAALVAVRDQMEQLVQAIVEIGSDLELDVTLKRIVNAAIELAGARYGALSIRASTAPSCRGSTQASTTRRRDASASSRSATACVSTT